MGKGDRKTRRGKFFKGSYGKTRPRKTIKNIAPTKQKKKKTTKKTA